MIRRKTFLSLGDRAMLARNYSTILASGAPLGRSIELLQKQPASPRLQIAVAKLAAAVEQGATVSEALASHVHLFGALFCSVAETGEKSGALPLLLSKLAHYFERCDAFNKKITGVVKYPAAVWLCAFGGLVTLLLFLIPKCIHRAMLVKENLPRFSQHLIALYDIVRPHLFLFSILTIIGAGCLALGLRSAARWSLMSSFGRAIPFFGSIHHKRTVRRFTEFLSIFSGCGLENSRLLLLAVQTVEESHIRRNILNELQRSAPLESLDMKDFLRKIDVFPLPIGDFLKSQSQQLTIADQVKKISEFYREEIESEVSSFVLVFGPAMVVLFGCLGGAILIALTPSLLKVVGN
jgi:general secretion pathway protein F